MASITTEVSNLSDLLAAKAAGSPPVVLQPQTESPLPLDTQIPDPATTPMPTQVGDQAASQTSPELELEDDFEFDEDPDKAKSATEPVAEPIQSDASAAEEKPLDPDKDIVGAMLATSRGKRIYADYKELTEVGKPVEEGGIGYKPSAQEIKEFHESHQQRSQMVAAFSAGDPQGAAEWIQGWFGKYEDGSRNLGAETVLETLPFKLAEMDPDAFNQYMVAPVAFGLVERYLEMSRSSQDPNLKAQAKFVADWLTWDRGGKVPQDPSRVTQQQGGDPEREALMAENRQLRGQIGNQRSTAIQGQMQEIQSNLDAAKDQALKSDIDRLFSKIEPAIKSQPGGEITLRALKSEFAAEMQQAIQKNQANLAILKAEEKTAVRTGNRDATVSIVRKYKRLYEGAFMEKHKAYLNAAGARIKASNDATVLRLQQAAQKTGASPGMSSPAIGNSNGSFRAKRDDESLTEYLVAKGTSALVSA